MGTGGVVLARAFCAPRARLTVCPVSTAFASSCRSLGEGRPGVEEAGMRTSGLPSTCHAMATRTANGQRRRHGNQESVPRRSKDGKLPAVQRVRVVVGASYLVRRPRCEERKSSGGIGTRALGLASEWLRQSCRASNGLDSFGTGECVRFHNQQ